MTGRPGNGYRKSWHPQSRRKPDNCRARRTRGRNGSRRARIAHPLLPGRARQVRGCRTIDAVAEKAAAPVRLERRRV